METRRSTMRSDMVRRGAWRPFVHLGFRDALSVLRSKPYIALVAAPLMVVLGTIVAACSDDENGFRRGFIGDTCSRTDDCSNPLRCVDNVCVELSLGLNDGGVNPDAYPPGPGPSASEGPWSACDECLDNECATALKNCGADCVAIEACIETTCVGLSAAGATMDESTCFTQCQSKYAAGKTQHLALVDCATKTKCYPECTFYPQDYDLCRTFMNNGDCYGYNQACENNLNCKNFRDCVKFCPTLQDCLACDDTPEGQQGRVILEAHERCLATECLTESWIP